MASSALGQLVAVGGGQIEVVDRFQLANNLEGFFAERAGSLEGMQDDALEQVAQRHLVVLGERFQDFHDPLFQAHARLDTLDEALASLFRSSHKDKGCTLVIMYQGT